MKIEKIKKLKNGQYEILFSTGEKIVTYDEVILQNQLLNGSCLDASICNKIEQENAYYKNYKKLLKYVSTRVRSEKEINLYLDKLLFTEKEKKQAIASLKKLGFYSDAMFCKAFIADKMYLTSFGPNKIKEELLKYGVKEEDINRLIEKIPEEEIREKAEKELTKKWNQNHKISSNMFKKKLLIEFTNLGYDSFLIQEILDTFPDKDERWILQKELEKCQRLLSKKYKEEELEQKIKQKLYQKGFDPYLIDEIMYEKNA